MYEEEGKLQISMCNQIKDEAYVSIFGKIPVIQKKSHAEAEIEYHGISSALFENLWNKYKTNLLKF